MLRKLLTVGAIFCASTSTFAQEFTITSDTVSASTSGTVPGDLEDFASVTNYLKNTSGEAFKFKWQLITPASLPSGWVLQGFCDNLLCRPTGGPWSTGAVQESGTLNAGNSSLLKLQMCAPTTSPDGTEAVVKFRFFTGTHSDTATFIIRKDNTTGLNAISLKDERVVLSPNPAVNQVRVFADKSLAAKNITVVNMLGRTVMSQDIAAGSEEAVVNLSSVASGMYMVRVSDAKGDVITSRKLTKN